MFYFSAGAPRFVVHCEGRTKTASITAPVSARLELSEMKKKFFVSHFWLATLQAAVTRVVKARLNVLWQTFAMRSQTLSFFRHCSDRGPAE